MFDLDEDKSYKLSKVIDKKDKIDKSAFETAVFEIVGERASELTRLMEANDRLLSSFGDDNEGVKELIDVLERLDKVGIQNVEFDPYLMRGFDYYTGIVFEVFDTNEDNQRSIFGGGRYDDLLNIFDAEKVPSVGFGVGDVTTRDFLETHQLLPKSKKQTEVYICTVKSDYIPDATVIAKTLREQGVNTEVDIADKIGEFSLTDSRVSRITKFMANTLFDENIGGQFGNTHVALGRAYKDSLAGDQAALSPDEWGALGFNESPEHTDIISTTDRTVTAIGFDEKETVIFKDGKFQV
jgi:histidyl-tRNA synthetase